MVIGQKGENGIGGGGGGSATLIEKSITENGIYNASEDSADGYSKVTVDVANSYTQADEGKVVSNGSLVAQTTHAEITENGTYDITTNNSVSVNVASGGGISVFSLTAFTTDTVSNLDLVIFNFDSKTYLSGFYDTNVNAPNLTTIKFNYPAEFNPQCTTQSVADIRLCDSTSSTYTGNVTFDTTNHTIALKLNVYIRPGRTMWLSIIFD